MKKIIILLSFYIFCWHVAAAQIEDIIPSKRHLIFTSPASFANPDGFVGIGYGYLLGNNRTQVTCKPSFVYRWADMTNFYNNENLFNIRTRGYHIEMELKESRNKGFVHGLNTSIKNAQISYDAMQPINEWYSMLQKNKIAKHKWSAHYMFGFESKRDKNEYLAIFFGVGFYNKTYKLNKLPVDNLNGITNNFINTELTDKWGPSGLLSLRFGFKY